MLLCVPMISHAAYPDHIYINQHQYQLGESAGHPVLVYSSVVDNDQVWQDLRKAGLENVVDDIFVAAHFPLSMLYLKEGVSLDDPALRQALEAVPGVRRVEKAPMLNGTFPAMATRRILVRFTGTTPWSEAQKLLAAYPVSLIEVCPYADDAYMLNITNDAINSVALANQIYEEHPKQVLFAEVDFIKKAVLRFRPNDTFYNRQWHLNNTGSWLGYSGTAGVDVNAEAAWEISRGDRGTIIAIVDDGMELNHPDFGNPSKIVDPYDALSNDTNPTPPCTSSSQGPYGHGIACAGVAAGEGNNGIGVSGLCMNCSVMPVRLIADQGVADSTVASVFRRVCDNGAAVINNSWGYSERVTMSSYLKSGIDYCNQNGRGGLGTSFTWASGNDNRYIYPDEMESYSGVICVGASNNSDGRSGYSNYGPGLDVVAPSNDYDGWSIVTTDYSGSCGYNNNGTYFGGGQDLDTTGNYTYTFGGTSSAAPLTAGLVGLVVSTNPGLTWQEVMTLIKDTADGGARTDYMGDGRIDAYAALLQAQAGGGCGSIDWQGKCIGDNAMWCENETLVSMNCTQRNEECGLNDSNLNRCLPCEPTTLSCRDGEDNDCDEEIDEQDECSGNECWPNTFQKSCQGTKVISCTQDKLITFTDCADYDMTCGTTNGSVACVTGPCVPSRPDERSCRDGVDNDCDSQTDEPDECATGECLPASYTATCNGNTRQYCSSDRLVATQDCAADGMDCVGGVCTGGTDGDVDVNECDPATHIEYCEGNLLVMCTDGNFDRFDCGTLGNRCQLNTDSGAYECMPPGPDECVPTAIDCSDNIDNDCDTEVDEADECPTTACGNIGSEGACVGSILYTCYDGSLIQADCAQLGKICAQSAMGVYSCTTDTGHGASSSGCAAGSMGFAGLLMLLGVASLRRRRG